MEDQRRGGDFFGYSVAVSGPGVPVVGWLSGRYLSADIVY